MRVTIIIILTTVLMIPSMAQEWLIEGSRWTNELSGFGYEGYSAYELKGDTIIDSREYSLLHYEYHLIDVLTGGDTSDYCCASLTLREEDGALIRRRDSREIVLYDMSLVEGDTFVMEHFNTRNQDTFIISSLEILEIDGNPLVSQTMRSIEDKTVEYQIVERIGYTGWRHIDTTKSRKFQRGFLLMEMLFDGFSIDPQPTLRCYQDEDLIYNPDSLVCDTIYWDSPNRSINRVKTINIISSETNIRIDSKEELKSAPYRIIDLSGRICKSDNQFNLETGINRISISELIHGVYILELEVNGRRMIHKFVK